jgi:hypothetical protein
VLRRPIETTAVTGQSAEDRLTHFQRDSVSAMKVKRFLSLATSALVAGGSPLQQAAAHEQQTLIVRSPVEVWQRGCFSSDSSQKISSLTRAHTAGVAYGCRSPKWVPLEVPNLVY